MEDRQILEKLSLYRKARETIGLYLNQIQQYKEESRVKVSSQQSYYKCETNKFKSTQCQTGESVHQVDIMQFIERYERMLKDSENYHKVDSEGVDDILQLSQTESLLQSNFIITNPSKYDTSNFGIDNQQLANKFQQIRHNFGIDSHNESEVMISRFPTFYEQQLKDSMLQIEKKINTNHFSQKKSDKSFDQFYKEFVCNEIDEIQKEISEMHKFLQRVSTAKKKLSDSFNDLRQLCITNNSSIANMNINLESIENLKNSMLIQMKQDIDEYRLQSLRNMKNQIKEHFNNVEVELKKINENSFCEI